jgi:hypothetical protein
MPVRASRSTEPCVEGSAGPAGDDVVRELCLLPCPTELDAVGAVCLREAEEGPESSSEHAWARSESRFASQGVFLGTGSREAVSVGDGKVRGRRSPMIEPGNGDRIGVSRAARGPHHPL